MDVKALLTDDDAVSPVIGVILMVAITVILAAVIGTFVLQLGEQTGNAQPTTSFDFDFDESVDSQSELAASDGTGDANGELSVTHNGGDKITDSQLSAKDDDGDGPHDIYGSAGSDVTTGDTDTVQVGSNDTVKVIWTASGGGDSAPLGNWQGPDA